MTTIKIHLIFGFILVIASFLFEFGYLAPKVSDSFKANSIPYLNSFDKYMYDLIKSYTLMLGLLNIVLALVNFHFYNSPKLDWIILILMISGSIIFIIAGLWYASAGPAFKWELRCTILTIGFSGILLSLGLEIYKLLFT